MEVGLAEIQRPWSLLLRSLDCLLHSLSVLYRFKVQVEHEGTHVVGDIRLVLHQEPHDILPAMGNRQMQRCLIPLLDRINIGHRPTRPIQKQLNQPRLPSRARPM